MKFKTICLNDCNIKDDFTSPTNNHSHESSFVSNVQQKLHHHIKNWL